MRTCSEHRCIWRNSHGSYGLYRLHRPDRADGNRGRNGRDGRDGTCGSDRPHGRKRTRGNDFYRQRIDCGTRAKRLGDERGNYGSRGIRFCDPARRDGCHRRDRRKHHGCHRRDRSDRCDRRGGCNGCNGCNGRDRTHRTYGH